ncbi:MAG: hypothetical protein KDD53_03005, partial [Bdellovibrionales bacterium]|nr:hypothetical protein [Bdellovibrionales bacterium]
PLVTRCFLRIGQFLQYVGIIGAMADNLKTHWIGPALIRTITKSLCISGSSVNLRVESLWLLVSFEDRYRSVYSLLI